MSTKWQRRMVDIPKDYGPLEREAIAQEILDYVVDRAKEGKGKGGRKFKGYSESYIKSLDFKIAGKSKNRVDLTLSGDMLGSMKLLSHRSGQINYGFENGTEENAKADGNIRGTYGNSSSVGPSRDFLGLTKKELDAILEKYPRRDREKSLERAELVNSSRDFSESVGDVETEDSDG